MYKRQVDGLSDGNYKLVMRVPNKLSNGHPIRFANKTQDADMPGWLTLGEIRLDSDLYSKKRQATSP